MTTDTRSTRRYAAALLAVAFVAGLAVGAVADRAYVATANARDTQTRRDHRSGGPPDVDQIPLPLEQLDLTRAQTDSLHAIARHWRPQAGDALNAFRERVSGLENLMFADMLCVLTPDQRTRYKAATAKFSIPDSIVAERFKRVDGGTCGG